MKSGMRQLLVFVTGIVLAVSMAGCPGGGDDNNNSNGDNTAPVASAGPDQNVVTGTEVTLDGSGSTDADHDTLTYSWSFANVPGGSTLASGDISGATTVNPIFTPDADGSYVVQLVVDDGTVNSAADTVTITAVTPVPLPDTGQDICYDATHSPAICNGTTGQDGEYSINPMGFTNSPDGTVTDNVTGLMWQKEDDDTVYSWYQAAGIYNGTFNSLPIDVCGSLPLGGYDDWRLPSEMELMNIVNYGVYSPAIDTTYFPNTKAVSNYCSSTIGPLGVWYVSFNRGVVDIGGKAGSCYVRCVRGNPSPPQSFTDNGDGTVTDNVTGLMWQKCSAGQNNDASCSGGIDSNMSYWQNALDYCNELELADYTDWRLPNIKELRSIVDQSRYSAGPTEITPAIDSTYFPNTSTSFYWSSTTRADSPFFAWDAASDGSLFYILKTNYSLPLPRAVRCVR